jgi:DNA-binding Lrp family transcriptional regulator
MVSAIDDVYRRRHGDTVSVQGWLTIVNRHSGSSQSSRNPTTTSACSVRISRPSKITQGMCCGGTILFDPTREIAEAMSDQDRPKRSDSDRRLRQADKFARVLRVLELIQGRARHRVNDIAAELECSERTIFRDLAVLEVAGVPWFFDEVEQSYRVRPGYNFPAVNLTDDELIGQAMAASMSSAPGLDVTSGATPVTRKLRVTSKEESAKLLAEVERVTSVLDLKLADHSQHHETIKTVQWALIQG